MLALLVRFYCVLLLSAALLAGCNAAHDHKSDQPAPGYDPTVSAADTTKAKPQSVAKLVGQVVAPLEDSAATATPAAKAKKTPVRFEVKESLLLERFIHEFGDGTVVDKVLITPIRDDPRAKPTYYLVGMGQLNGKFRAMALPLYVTKQNGLFLRPEADRHIAASTSCPMCYFHFSHGQITGVDCAEEGGSAGSRCAYRIESGNRFFPGK